MNPINNNNNINIINNNNYSSNNNKAIKDSTRHPRCDWCCHIANLNKHKFVFESDPLVPLCENVMLSTKPEVHNLCHRRQRRTESRWQVRCTETFVKFGHVGLRYMSGQQTDRQTYTDTHKHTDMPIAILCIPL